MSINSEADDENEIILHNGKKYIKSPFLVCFLYTAKKIFEYFLFLIGVSFSLIILFIIIGGAIISIYLACIKQWHAFRSDDDNDDKYTFLNDISLMSFVIWIIIITVIVLSFLRKIYDSQTCQNFIINTFYREINENSVISTTTTPITL